MTSRGGRVHVPISATLTPGGPVGDPSVVPVRQVDEMTVENVPSNLIDRETVRVLVATGALKLDLHQDIVEQRRRPKSESIG